MKHLRRGCGTGPLHRRLNSNIVIREAARAYQTVIRHESRWRKRCLVECREGVECLNGELHGDTDARDLIVYSERALPARLATG